MVYMHKTLSILENDMPKILWTLRSKLDPLIPRRRLVDLAVPADHRVKMKEIE